MRQITLALGWPPRSSLRGEPPIWDQIAHVWRQPFRCAEDARKASDKQTASLRFHEAEVTVAAIERSLKRGRVERPRRGEQTPTETVWTVSWALSHDEDAIAAERRRASCFVLLTDHIDEDDWGDAAALAA